MYLNCKSYRPLGLMSYRINPFQRPRRYFVGSQIEIMRPPIVKCLKIREKGVKIYETTDTQRRFIYTTYAERRLKVPPLPKYCANYGHLALRAKSRDYKRRKLIKATSPPSDSSPRPPLAPMGCRPQTPVRHAICSIIAMARSAKKKNGIFRAIESTRCEPTYMEL